MVKMPDIKQFYENSRHVLHISYKPAPHEFSRTAKIVIIGILIIGFIGFIISLIIGFVTGSPL